MIREIPITDFIPTAQDTIWDVRDQSAYHNAHLEHATNQPLASLTPTLLAQTTGTVYVLCGGGSKAGKAAALLDSYDPARDIVHLTGGTRGAISAGMPIIRSNA